MHRRHRLAHLILATGVALSLTPLIVAIDAQAQIAFVSNRDGNPEIYVMDARWWVICVDSPIIPLGTIAPSWSS